MDMTGRANAQRPIAVIQSDLGDRPKDVLANRLERDGPRKKHWHDACTKDVGDPTLGGGKAECAIGGRNQPPGKADPFGLVTVDKLSGAWPCRTAASFQARSMASPIPVFMP